MKTIALMLISCVMLAGCGEGPEKTSYRTQTVVTQPSDDQRETIDRLEKKILSLAGTVDQLTSLVQSDFSSCPAAGDTVDPLINKICKVSQAATVEARVEMKGQLASYASILQGQVDALNSGLATLQATLDADVASINSQISAITSSVASISTALTSLASRMTSAEAAISALQTLTAAITGTLNGTMAALDIGTENLAAGPVYESILRRVDKTRINAYVEATDAPLGLPNNPLSATDGSATIVVTTSSPHGLSVGNTVRLTGLSSGKGITAADLLDEKTVQTVPTATTFTVVVPRQATSGGSFGGNSGVAQKIVGRGLATIWKTVDGADAAVRTTTLGNKRYNFIVKAMGDVCYDKTNATATFATINAGGANVVCK